MARFNSGRQTSLYARIGPTNQWAPVLDDDRSQFPYDLNSGWGAFSATTLFTSILAPNFVSGASVINFFFKPETIMITNKAGTTNELVFYDGQTTSAGNRTALDVIIPASDTLFLTKDLLRGVYFISGVFTSNLNSNISVRIGGKLIESIAGQL